MKSILVFDPGENTGWVFHDFKGTVTGGTSVRSHMGIAMLIYKYLPDVVVFERFNLYPGKAASLSWNTFYPCEVIGVIRYCCQAHNIPIVEQAPSDKRYAGNLDARWARLKEECTDVTEHTKDAYIHLLFYLRKHGSC